MLKRTLIVSIFAVTMLATNARADALAELGRYVASLEKEARQEGEKALEATGKGEFSQGVVKSQNLADAGQYAEAAALLTSLLDNDQGPGWKEFLTTRVEILRKWSRSGEVSLVDYRKFYVNTGPAWFRSRARPIIRLWQMNGVDEPERYALLRDLFRMKKDARGERLVLEAVSEAPDGRLGDAASADLALGNAFVKEKDFDKAEKSWLRVMEKYPKSTAWPKAVFNLGLSKKLRGDFDGATDLFSSLLKAKVNNLEQSDVYMETYRNYQPRAQWEIATILLAQKKYREALAAFHKSETVHPFRSWCGVDSAFYEYRYPLYQGLCHEWLGEPEKAIRFYLIASKDNCSGPASVRIARIYLERGQVSSLKSLLDDMDRIGLETERRRERKRLELDDARKQREKAFQLEQLAHREAVRGMEERRRKRNPLDPDARKEIDDLNDAIEELERNDLANATASQAKTVEVPGELRDEELLKRSPSKELRNVMRLWKMEEKADWKGLIASLNRNDKNAWKGRWCGFEAARLLAKHPKATVPLLINHIEAADFRELRLHYYALGLCSTDKAVSALVGDVKEDVYHQRTPSIIHALKNAGKPGLAALTRLETEFTGRPKELIRYYRDQRLVDEFEDILFPPIPKTGILPTTCPRQRIRD